MRPPKRPQQEDCCGSGCNPCIFDVYEKQLMLYKTQAESGKQNEPMANSIKQLEYTTFQLKERIKIFESHDLLKFILNGDSNAHIYWKPGDHFLFKCTAEKYPCTRAYTPITKYFIGSQDFFCNQNEFMIIVKRYDNGIVSNHLCNLSLKSPTLWRGPYGNYNVCPNKFNRIIMVAQGTGIAPFISIIQDVLNNEDDMTKIILFFCCKSKDSILFRHELYTFQSYWNFAYKIYLNEPASSIKYNEPINNFKLDECQISSLKPYLDNDQFLLCGSKSFMEMYTNVLLKLNVKENNIIAF